MQKVSLYRCFIVYKPLSLLSLRILTIILNLEEDTIFLVGVGGKPERDSGARPHGGCRAAAVPCGLRAGAKSEHSQTAATKRSPVEFTQSLLG